MFNSVTMHLRVSVTSALLRTEKSDEDDCVPIQETDSEGEVQNENQDLPEYLTPSSDNINNRRLFIWS